MTDDSDYRSRYCLAVIGAIVAAGLLALYAEVLAGSEHAREVSDFNGVNVVEVRDGDSIRIDLGPALRYPLRTWLVRVDGIDTPEMHDPDQEMRKRAEAARVRLEHLLKGKTIDLKNVRGDKFFRLLARVEVNGKDIGAQLIQEGHAREYHGEKKEPW